MSISIARSDQARPVAPRRTAAVAAAVAPLWPALFLFYSTLVPMEVRFSVAEQTIYPPRMAAFILLPWLINRLARGALRFIYLDGIMAAGVAWMVISFMLFYDVGTGFLRSAPLAFDVIVPYLVARTCIRDLTDLRRFAILAAPGLFVAGLSMAMESVTRVPIVKPFAASIFGRLAIYENGVAVGDASFIQQTRLGLMRASGPFSHPILGGIFLASFLPLYIWSGIKGWPKKMGLFGSACSIFSLSSGAFLVLMLGLFVIAAERIQQKFKKISWSLILWGIFLAGLGVNAISKNGIVPILSRYTLDPATARYRQYIWQYGSLSVERHPIFGIGLTDYDRLPWMGASVDSNWLLLAIRHGIIVPFAFLFVSISGLFYMGRFISRRNHLDRKTSIAVSAMAGTFALAGLTVSFFGQTLTLYYFTLGLVISLSRLSGWESRGAA